MPSPLSGSSIVLGVTGSIACYKAVDLASKLTQAGARVDVILTQSAANFVTPLTFRSLTHRPVVTDQFDAQSELAVEHVALAQRADVIVVAPATAHTIARLAHGLADDALTTTILASSAPVALAPAMDGHMYSSPITQENLGKLHARGFTIMGPVEGYLASGQRGVGRMVEVPQIVDSICAILGRRGDLAGRSVVVSAGGTQEPVDPVRVLTNRSSGKMGYAIAQAARDRGARVTLVTAPTALPDPVGVETVHIETALEMRDAIHLACEDGDVLIMAAAVADYRPVEAARQKIKKSGERWTIDLTLNPDILAGAPGRVLKVGFAAESHDLLKSAREKLVAKNVALMVANDITAPGSGFAADTNKVYLVDRERDVVELPLLSKYEVGHRILDRVAELLPASPVS